MKLGDVPPDERLAYIQKALVYVTNVVRSLGVSTLDAARQAATVEKYANAILAGTSPMDVFDAILTSEGRPVVPVYVHPGHFYSPVVDPAEAGEHARAVDMTVATVTGVALDAGAMTATWRELLPYLTTFPFPATKSERFRYFTDNVSYGIGDARLLSAMIRAYRPRRIVEIGSGMSSACMLDTIEYFGLAPCALTFVEPYAAAELRAILGTHAAHAEIREVRVQAAPLELFESLEAGDMLFIDSSHVLKTGSDVCFELFEILPRLRAGVLVHIHDMFWPFEYPHDWILDGNRSWNELYAVRAFLTDNAQWDVRFFSQYLCAVAADVIDATVPSFRRESHAALWLQRR